MEDKEALIKIISENAVLCDNWAAGRCHQPDGWRNTKLSTEQKEKLPDCICKPGNTKILCDKCRPDSVLLDCKPSWFEEKMI